jgi:hypothetical protein
MARKVAVEKTYSATIRVTYRETVYVTATSLEEAKEKISSGSWDEAADGGEMIDWDDPKNFKEES